MFLEVIKYYFGVDLDDFLILIRVKMGYNVFVGSKLVRGLYLDFGYIFKIVDEYWFCLIFVCDMVLRVYCGYFVDWMDGIKCFIVLKLVKKLEKEVFLNVN